MTRRQLALILTVVVFSSAISAAIAYHYGTRKDPVRPAYRPNESSAAENAPCVPYTEASSLVGNSSCVTGRVLKVFTSKAGNTYLDFCEDYRSCPFSSVIFSQDRTKFGDLTSLQGQFVEIRGLVSYYKERPQIVIRAPEQVKLRE
jgi:hypothetical protein